MLSLAFIRQFLGRYWPSLLLLLRHLRYQLEKTEINGHSHTGTLDRLRWHEHLQSGSQNY